MTIILFLAFVLFDRDNYRTIYVHTGDIVTIKLQAPAESRAWQPTLVNPVVLQYLGESTETARPKTVFQVFTFRVVGVGSTLLDLQYRGPPGRNCSPPMTLYRIYVHVNR
jgi:hypothetical protein